MNSIKRHGFFFGAALALLASTACGPTQNNATQKPAECKAVSVEGEDYCVIKQEIIIETGYSCPSSYQYRYEVSDLTVCSNRSTPPTRPIIFEIWRLAYGQEPPVEGDMGGTDMGETDMDEWVDFGLPPSCDAIEASYQAAVDNDLDRSCQQDSDCEVIQGDCHMSEAGERCTLAARTGADTSALEGWKQIYDAEACRANQANCEACPNAQAVCNQGTCEAKPARSCEQIEQDYAAIYDNLPTTCQQDADCVYARTTGCGVTEAVSQTCKPVSVIGTSDEAAMTALNEEHRMLGCGVGDPDCNICEREPVKCEQGMCVVGEPAPARTCDDVEQDYAQVFDNLPKTCQQNSDCEGLPWDCGLSSQVMADVCTATVTTGTDTSALSDLSKEYEQLNCPVPVCAACPPATYTCEQGMCVGTIQ